jgi:hypothetical protein
VQLAFQRGQERNGRATAGGLRRDAVAVGAELPGDRDRLRVEVHVCPGEAELSPLERDAAEEASRSGRLVLCGAGQVLRVR